MTRAVRGRVLITGDEDPTGRLTLAALRSLGRAGWMVGLASPSRGIGSSSRWATAWHYVPPSWSHPDAFVEGTEAAIRAGGYDMVFTGGDAGVLALSAARDSFSARVPYPAINVTTLAFDKLASVPDALAAGLAVPKVTPLTEAVIEEIHSPVMLKSRLHWTPGSPGGRARLDPVIVRTPAEARARLAEIHAVGGDGFLQEIVPGGYKISYVSLLSPAGEVWAHSQQWTRWSWPPDRGHFTRGETMSIDPELSRKSIAFLRRVGWYGLSELEFLVSPSGEPQLIDFQGRYYGSMALAMAAGTDYPQLWAAAVLGDWPSDIQPVPPLAARPGYRYVRTESDLMRLLVERRGGLLRDAAGYVRYRTGAVGSLWSARDPVPAAWWSFHMSRRIGRRIVRRVRSRSK